MRSPPTTMCAMACDVIDPQAVDALFAAVHTRCGRLDVVFNNAGISLPATWIGDIAWEDWCRVLSVNLDGAFLIARDTFRMMRDQSPKGGIINNCSISAHVLRMGSAAHTASKTAITGLTRTISRDGRRHDIACGQIDIGNAASDMTEAMREGVPQPDGTTRPEPVMDVSHAADAVVHMADLPLSVDAQFTRLCCTNPAGESSRASSVGAGLHKPPPPPIDKTRNGPACNEVLNRRGSLTIWFDPEMIREAAPTCRRGRRQTHSDAAILTCLTMKVRFGMALRQTTGFVERLLRLVGLDRTVPDLSTLSRRQRTLAVSI